MPFRPNWLIEIAQRLDYWLHFQITLCTHNDHEKRGIVHVQALLGGQTQPVVHSRNISRKRMDISEQMNAWIKIRLKWIWRNLRKRFNYKVEKQLPG